MVADTGRGKEGEEVRGSVEVVISQTFSLVEESGACEGVLVSGFREREDTSEVGHGISESGGVWGGGVKLVS